MTQPIILHFERGQRPTYRTDGHILSYFVVDFENGKYFFQYPAFEEDGSGNRFYWHRNATIGNYDLLGQATIAGERLIDAHVRLIHGVLARNWAPLTVPPFQIDPGPRPADKPWRKPLAWPAGRYDREIGADPPVWMGPVPSIVHESHLDGYIVNSLRVGLDERELSFKGRMLVPNSSDEEFTTFGEERFLVDGGYWWDLLNHACTGESVLDETIVACVACMADCHAVPRDAALAGWPPEKSITTGDEAEDLPQIANKPPERRFRLVRDETGARQEREDGIEQEVVNGRIRWRQTGQGGDT